MQPIFHWLALGFSVRGNANFMFLVGGNANLSVFRYQHFGILNAEFREKFCIAMDHRLYRLKAGSAVCSMQPGTSVSYSAESSLALSWSVLQSVLKLADV